MSINFVLKTCQSFARHVHLHFQYQYKIFWCEMHVVSTYYNTSLNIWPSMLKQQIIKLTVSFMWEHSDTFFFNRLVLLFSRKRKIFRFNFKVFPKWLYFLGLRGGKEVLWERPSLFLRAFLVLLLGDKKESASVSWYILPFKELMFESLMLLGYLLHSKMFTLVINRIRSGNYILSGAENKGTLAWLQGNDSIEVWAKYMKTRSLGVDIRFTLLSLHIDFKNLCYKQ